MKDFYIINLFNFLDKVNRISLPDSLSELHQLNPTNGRDQIGSPLN